MSSSRRFECPGAVRGRAVRGVLELPDTAAPHPFAILVHGYTSYCEWGFWPEIARRLAAIGIASLRFNFSGDGVGEDLRSVEDLEAIAVNTYSAELRDLDAVRDWADRQVELDPSRAAIVGHSRGGGVALLHAAERGDYRRVVCWAPLPQILRFSPERLAEWRANQGIEVMHHTLGTRVRLELSVLDDAERHRDRLDIPAAAARLHCPLLVINGARDRGLKIEECLPLVEASPDPASRHLSIDGAGHVFGAREPLIEIPARLGQLFEATSAWLAPVTKRSDAR